VLPTSANAVIRRRATPPESSIAQPGTSDQVLPAERRSFTESERRGHIEVEDSPAGPSLPRNGGVQRRRSFEQVEVREVLPAERRSFPTDRRRNSFGRAVASTLREGTSDQVLLSEHGGFPPSQRTWSSNSRPGAGRGAVSISGVVDVMEPSAPELTGDEAITAAAPMLARKYHLELFQTQTALLELSKAKRNCQGGLDYADFYRVVCQIFGARSIKGATVRTMWEETGMRRGVRVEKFLEWQMLNMFSVTTSLIASEDKRRSEELVTKLANDFSVRAVDIDRIKREFDRYDTDKSGFIDFDEFRRMLESILNAATSSDLSFDRVQKCWREIDSDGSGQVDFGEFTAWYLKYFDPEASSANQKASCKLAEAFYDGFSPEILRHRHLGAMSSA